MTPTTRHPILPKLVGTRVKRREDPRLIQGRATYVDDMKLPGMLHLAFRRSDIAHGIIKTINTETAEEMPGVVAVYTGEQISKFLDPMPIGTPFPAPDHWAVAVNRVRYVGEPIAVVVANDRYLARDGADAIEVEIEELPAVIDPENAQEEESVILHDDFKNNVAVGEIYAGTGTDPTTFSAVDDSKVNAAFEDADIVISQRMKNQRLAPSAMEGRGVIAHFEPGKDMLTIWSSTQNPHILRTFIAQMTGLGEHQVRAIAPEVGGGFGAKINIYGEEYVAAALSKQIGKPLKWIEDRSEAFMSTIHGRDILGDIEIAANKDGTILGIKANLIANIGAYEMLLTALIPTLTGMMLNGVYKFGVVRSRLTEVFTNKTPTDAYRGAGRPESIYFLERIVDMLARELKIDPAELRRKNFIPQDEFPYPTQPGLIYDSGNYEAALDRALEIADWEKLKEERTSAQNEGRLVGLGLSFYVEVCGLGPSSTVPTGGWEFASVTVERGGKITATTGSSPHGQGNETTFSQMLADHFSIPLENISILHGDTGVVKQGIGTFGSRSQAVGGAAMMLAANKVSEKMKEFAATMLTESETSPTDLLFENGQIVIADAPEVGIDFTEVADFAYVPVPLPEGMEPGLSEEAFFEPDNNTYPFGCHIAMIEIDKETGEPKLLKMVAVDDCGNVINPLIVEGQVHGGLAQGIGQALFEEVIYDQDGQLITGSFMDYVMPRATDFPQFELDRTVTPTPVNPLGAKGVGEAGTIGSTPCVVNAAVDALQKFGVQHIDMPLKPEKLWEIIQGDES
ncbi:MAG: xanthine dehydrogenase family protein molybdopterin-binding subunit [Candidatus Poribacteria bacterium]|nr:xanthine dehydrogenase family protein molybdopterin-binding subunit [Candidatus Poribacteria bacterium]